MPSNYPRRRSIVWPVTLVAIGVLLLIPVFRPDFDPWPVFSQYWPVILILAGVGMLVDNFRAQRNPDARRSGWVSCVTLAAIVLLIFFGTRMVRAKSFGIRHESSSIERGSAQSVQASIQIPAGTMHLSGAPVSLLDAEFRYRPSDGEPSVEYGLDGKVGRLTISQEQGGTHFGTKANDWVLRLANDLPIELDMNMGAGESALDFRGLDVRRLDVNVGAGELKLDLRGNRKADLEANIVGGAGSAEILLPREVGVRVAASGGLGVVSAHGLDRDGDDYVNAAYRKSPVTITLTIQGGVGTVDLREE